MDISKLNLLNLLGLAKKVEKTDKSAVTPKENVEPRSSSGSQDVSSDSIQISLEGLIKKASMEAREDLGNVRQDKVEEIKEKIASSQYQTNPQDVARAILNGRQDVYEELK